MAPDLIPRAGLTIRQVVGTNCNNNNINCNCDTFGNNCDCSCNGNWGNWGRWVLLAAVIIFFIAVAVGFACINSRRRRRAGMAPRYGTGWAAGKTPFGHSAPQYNQGAVPPYQPPPPVYGQHTGNTFNSNDGYYGQQTGIELQEPQNVYQQPHQESGYAPPTGAPPRTKN